MRKKESKVKSPVVRLRFMLVGIVLLMAAMSGPLALVWKQSHINQVSIELENMNDTLEALDREIASLRLECEKLSSTARIERLAKEALSLDYPSSDQIVIIDGGEAGRKLEQSGIGRLFAWVRRSISGERG
ncbi:MAG: cell division protein FtsL [Chitinispirillaceae bacterium]